MMRGEMDDTEESPENEIIFLGETLHFFSPNRYRIFGFALTNSDASALNFIGVRQPRGFYLLAGNACHRRGRP